MTALVKSSLILALVSFLPTSILGQCPLTGEAIPAGYSLRNGRYYKYSSTSMTHAQAAGQCQSDNASLAVVLNENDKVAMDYYRSSVGSDFWIGLKKKSGNEGSRCDQGGCDNVLEWDNGVRFAPQRYADFLRNMDVHPYVEATETNTDANCFVVETTRLTDRACSAEYNPFLCQFTCIVPETMPLPVGDEPTFTSWYLNVRVDNQTNTAAEYPRLCQEECKKNCSTWVATLGETKCFGKMHTTALKALSNTTVQMTCECGESTAKRYPGRFCGPRRQTCHRQGNGEVDPGDTFEGIWVDGYNTFKNESYFSDMSPPK